MFKRNSTVLAVEHVASWQHCFHDHPPLPPPALQFLDDRCTPQPGSARTKQQPDRQCRVMMPTKKSTETTQSQSTIIRTPPYKYTPLTVSRKYYQSFHVLRAGGGLQVNIHMHTRSILVGSPSHHAATEDGLTPSFARPLTLQAVASRRGGEHAVDLLAEQDAHL